MTDNQSPALESTTSFAGFLVLYPFPAMKLDLDKVFKEKSLGDLQALLTEFRKCKTYRQRLDFWDKKSLHLQLAYPTSTDRKNLIEYQEILRKAFACENREEQNLLDVLTLEPFNLEETCQLFEWGIDRRKQMYTRLKSYYKEKYLEWGRINSTEPEVFNPVTSDGKPLVGEQLMYAEERYSIIADNRFHKKFREHLHPQTIPFSTLSFEQKVENLKNRVKHSLDAKGLLTDEWEKVNKNGFGIIDLTWAYDHKLMNGINVHLFNKLLTDLKKGKDLPVILQDYQHDRFGTWIDIDTYILAETTTKYKAFVRDFKFNEAESDLVPQKRSEKPTGVPLKQHPQTPDIDQFPEVTFEDYLTEEGKKVLPLIIKRYGDARPMKVVPVLFALIDLGLLSIETWALGHDENYTMLTKTFENLGTKEGVRVSVDKHNRPDAKHASEINIAKIRIQKYISSLSGD